MLCLYLVGVICRKRVHKGRIAIAALCCAVADVALVIAGGGRLSEGSVWLRFGIGLFELVVAVGIAYGKQGIVSKSILLFGVTVLLAGFFQLVPICNVGIFCLVGTVLLPFVTGGIRAFLHARQTQTSIYEARLYQNEKEKSFSAFMDTGNRLRLYGSSVPVVLVDETYLAEWIKAAEQSMPQKLVFLPYKGVGGKGILRGVRLRCALTLENGQTLSGEVAAVAAEHRLFSGCAYQMILQPEVLTMDCVTDTQEGERNVV